MAKLLTHELERTAVHEAGHAVACHRLFPDRDTGELSITPKDENLGAHRAQKMYVEIDTSDAEAEALFMADAIYSCAGYGALKALGYPEKKASLGCGLDFEEAGHRLADAKIKAVALMRRPENMKAIVFLANELLKIETMQPDHVAVAIDTADGANTMLEYQQFLEFQAISE